MGCWRVGKVGQDGYLRYGKGRGELLLLILLTLTTIRPLRCPGAPAPPFPAKHEHVLQRFTTYGNGQQTNDTPFKRA